MSVSVSSALPPKTSENSTIGSMTSGTAAADDITPEIYLYSVLQDHLLYNEMKPVVEEMTKRQPANADVAELAAYVKAKTETR